MIQNFPQPQFVLSIIAIPIRKTIRPAGAKSFSPTNAAWRATIAISFGSFSRSARDSEEHQQNAAADPDDRER